MIKRNNQKQLEEESVNLAYIPGVIIPWRKPRQELNPKGQLEVGADAEAMEE